MTLTLGSRPQHLEDGDLVRYMDRQLDRAGSRRTELHLSACGECAARLQALQDRGRQVSGWLAELEAPVADEQRALAMAAVERARFRARPQVWGGRGALAAAAVVALMLTMAFGTPPGRAWVGGAAERLGLGRLFPDTEQASVPAPPRETVAGPAAAAPAEPGAVEAESPAAPAAGRPQRAGPPPGTSAPVAFNPAGNYVLLQFESRQRAGAVTIWIRNIRTASGQVVAGRQTETMVPTSDGLQVRNARASRADYSVELPTRYRFIRIRIGDEPEQTIPVTRATQDGLWTVNLSDSGA